MRRASLHLLSGTNRICGVADDFISGLEITENLYKVRFKLRYAAQGVPRSRDIVLC
jgi:hypothetical protein